MPTSQLTAKQRQQRRQRMQGELTYWLERHNVQDEGYDMVARYAQEGDSTLAAYMPQGPFLLRNMLPWASWKHQGKGFVRDAEGRFIFGMFHADTLVSGLRIGLRETYAGMFDRHKRACGHGSAFSIDGSYYEGHWQDDVCEGFGFSVSPQWLKAGIWKNGKFRGERMQYTSERIYGIDISRYQHERGRRVFPIRWDRLRITHLGRRISEQRVSGQVDYPVSFVFIKSTEGISISNKYYAADYQSCRRLGIPVGAYHFFSTRQDARDQATWFLSNTRFQRGDLPPVLDLEPSDALIGRMGGAEELFRQVRVWISIVERATGVRPLLYVNQRFVNVWLPHAPDLQQDCQFWIARYGEYKPDIHLALWQLSADGRVSGIQGEVDLNVFNGYQPQWEAFLRDETIR